MNGKGRGGESSDVWVTSTPHTIASLVSGFGIRLTCNNSNNNFLIASP